MRVGSDFIHALLIEIMTDRKVEEMSDREGVV